LYKPLYSSLLKTTTGKSLENLSSGTLCYFYARSGSGINHSGSVTKKKYIKTGVVDPDPHGFASNQKEGRIRILKT
jgi:hypothetical protein